MPGADSEAVGQRFDRRGVECSAIYQHQRPLDRCLGSHPSRAEGCGLRPTAQTKTKTCTFSRRCALIERNVAREWNARSANGAAIDTGCFDRNVNDTIQGGIAAQHCSISRVKIVHSSGLHAAALCSETDVMTESESGPLP